MGHERPSYVSGRQGGSTSEEPEALRNCPGCHPELRAEGEWWHPDHDLWHQAWSALFEERWGKRYLRGDEP